MKKIFKINIVVLLLLIMSSLSSCGLFQRKEKTTVECTIKFAKSVDERFQPLEYYEDNVFEVNTKIYVIVDFTFINYTDVEDYVDFKVQIPYAKYYSTHEYNKGVIEPFEQYKNELLEDGTIEPKVELSEMTFYVKGGEIPFHYTYCFTIEANQVCEDVSFRVIFQSNSGLTGKGETTYEKIETYSFVLNEGDEINEN